MTLRNISLSVLGLLGALGGFAACGGDDSDSKGSSGGSAGTGGSGGTAGAGGTGGSAGAAGSDAGPDPAQVAACTANAKSICARHKECFPVIGGSLGNTCEATYRELCLATTFPEGSGYTVELLDACTASHASVSCEQWVQMTFSNINHLPKCLPPPGARADGAPCGVGSQCQSKYCSVGSAGGCGTCQKRVPAGGDCVANADCESGSYCQSSTCVLYRKEGESCDFANRCIGGTLICGTGGICEKLKQNVGDACTVNDCSIYEKGLFCDAQDLKCAPLVFSDLGGECGNTAAGGYAFCKEGNVCQVSSGQPMDWKGTCIAPKKLGEQCDPKFISGPNGGPCQFFQTCSSGVCQPVLDPSCK